MQVKFEYQGHLVKIKVKVASGSVSKCKDFPGIIRANRNRISSFSDIGLRREWQIHFKWEFRFPEHAYT